MPPGKTWKHNEEPIQGIGGDTERTNTVDGEQGRLSQILPLFQHLSLRDLVAPILLLFLLLFFQLLPFNVLGDALLVFGLRFSHFVYLTSSCYIRLCKILFIAHNTMCPISQV